MKKLFLLLIALTFGFNTFGQSRIGYTEKQIISEFSEFNFKPGRTEDGIKFISSVGERLMIIHYFNNQGISVMCSATPLDVGMLNFLVEKYNKNYVILSDRKWKYYDQNGNILKIELVEISNLLTFIFTEVK